MRDFVKGFGEIKQDGIYMHFVVYSCYPVMDCINELEFTSRAGVNSKRIGIDQFNSNLIPEFEDLGQNELNTNWIFFY